MEITYTTPLRAAWQRMLAMLFRPFQLEKWLVIGFSAFVANLLGHGGSLFSWNSGFHSGHNGAFRSSEQLEAIRDHVLTLIEKPAVLLAIALGLVVIGILLLLAMWVSARARFVFLENVVTGRGAFVEPWKRHGRLGRSLFLWYAAFSFAWLLPITVAVWSCSGWVSAVLMGVGSPVHSLGRMVLGLIVTGILAMMITFVSFLTRQFVVPLMMLHDETASRAWGRFWPLLTSHPGEFIAYTLFLVVVWIGVAVALVVAGVATCCIGLLLMMIPYVGSVVLLPVKVTERAFGPQFLAQFGPEWDLFTAKAPVATEPVGPLPG